MIPCIDGENGLLEQRDDIIGKIESATYVIAEIEKDGDMSDVLYSLTLSDLVLQQARLAEINSIIVGKVLSRSKW